MTPARHQPVAEFLFRTYIFRLQKKYFNGFYIIGEKPVLDDTMPLLLLPNHNSWWDGFWVYLLNEKLFQRKLFMMMLEEQIQRYSFFSRVGAFGIAPNNPKDTLRSLKYSLEVLEKNENTPALLCMYPVGEMLPWSTRQRPFKPGLEWILRQWNKGLQIGLLAMRPRFFDNQKADVFFHLKMIKTDSSASKPDLITLQEQHAQLISELDEQLRDTPNAQPIFWGKRSVQEKFDRFRIRND